MTQSDPTGHHDWHSASYVHEWIAGYEEQDRDATLHRITHLIPFEPDAAIRVLDVGGGWGPVTEVVLDTFPRAQVVLHDFSEAMLEDARRRLARHGAAVSFYLGDLLSSDWSKGLAGPFDAVVSSIAIHNVRFPDRIRAIYREIFPLVGIGGCFINLDHMATSTLANGAIRHAQAMERRQKIYAETGEWKSLEELTTRRGGGRSQAYGEPRSEDLRRIDSVEPATLVNQLCWLREAGFDAVDCFAREGNSALLGAFRVA